ncbi:regulator of nonsense transcripts 3A [Anguilla rostrata]|uniref:regulator of nonsense transcripts 3A n=1 Tax=Anguilla rostrata TaxID=7938 RepID=UPI0030D2A02D
MRAEKEFMTESGERKNVDIHFRDLPRDQDSVTTNSKPKEEKKEVFTKVVLRRLPPSLSKDQLEEQISPLPAFDYFEFFSADQSLYPHLFSRAYINFKNPEDIVLFRDRFDGYVFIDNKGQEYPAIVEFAPFQKVSKKKLKKKDTKAGSIEEDPEYRRFLENYCCDEEKVTANPETLLGEIEAKTRELIAKRTTPLLEYIKNKKLEKQVGALLKKCDRDEDGDSDRLKDRADGGESDRSKLDKPSGHLKTKHLDKEAKDKGQVESDREQREQGRRPREKEAGGERHRGREEARRRHRHHYELDKFTRRKEETKWGKGYCQDRAKKDGHPHHGYGHCPSAGDKAGKDGREDAGSRKERIRNKDRPTMQLYQPGVRSRSGAGSGGAGPDCFGTSPEWGAEPRFEIAMGTGSEKSGDE